MSDIHGSQQVGAERVSGQDPALFGKGQHHQDDEGSSWMRLAWYGMSISIMLSEIHGLMEHMIF